MKGEAAGKGECDSVSERVSVYFLLFSYLSAHLGGGLLPGTSDTFTDLGNGVAKQSSEGDVILVNEIYS